MVNVGTTSSIFAGCHVSEKQADLAGLRFQFSTSDSWLDEAIRQLRDVKIGEADKTSGVLFNSGGVVHGKLLDATLNSDVGMGLVSPAYWRRLTLVTGFQSGVDRAVGDMAKELSLPSRGWVPHDRWAEDGPIHKRYPVEEVSSGDPAARTELNTIDSDGTLILTVVSNAPRDGTSLMELLAIRHSRPYMIIDLDKDPSEVVIQKFRSWIDENGIRVLNIGGPRASYTPEDPSWVYNRTKTVLSRLLER